MAIRPPLLVTMGEPAGIGPELTARAWSARHALSLPPFAYVGDAQDLKLRAARIGIDLACTAVTVDAAVNVFPDALPVIATPLAAPSRPGLPNAANAPAVIEAIARAVALVHGGEAAAIVTNPIHKASLYGAGFRFPGHTEYLGMLAEQHWGKPARPVMMLACEELRVVPVTVHIALRDVPSALTLDLIVQTGRIVAHDLAHRFAIARPRLALAGLNPHAGEAGTLGREDAEIIAPAIAALRDRGIDASGPYPADAMFHPCARTRYDAALAMYHDQALIPIKTIAFDRAVNVTLGLPFVRTSPDHGTAFDIAGSGQADPSSLVEAIRLAARLTGDTAI